MKKKKISLSLAVVLLVLVSSATVCITLTILMLTGTLPKGGPSLWVKKLNEIQGVVMESYYGEIDDAYLADNVAYGYIRGLEDKYADYYTVEETTETKLSNKGEKIGIGVTAVVLSAQNLIYVDRIDMDGPAAKAGILEGDYIIAVDGVSVAQTGASDAFSALSGDAGTTVDITVLRGDETLTRRVERREFEITSVYAHMIDTTGYLLISRFNETTPKQLEKAVLEMQAAGATGLIFDLRNCGGGLVDATAKILDYLLPTGNIISATYADGSSKVLYTSDDASVDLPMTVLTTSNTASAAELFAAAIRDYGKGALIGTTTYGKGVMQRTYGLSDGSSVKFTIAEFFPPDGVNFNGIGLEPDIKVEFTDEQKAKSYLLDDSNDPHIVAAMTYLSAQ